MPKKDPILVALGQCPEKWNDFLWDTYGLPQEPSTRKEVQQDSIRVIDHRSKRLRLVSLDEAGLSATRLTDELESLQIELSDDQGLPLPRAWLRYLEYMDVVAEELSPKDKGAALKQLALEDAQSRCREQPPDWFQPMNASLGDPAEFKQRWIYGELEIRIRVSSRRDQVFEIWRLPPWEPEDLDEAGEPPGHWEVLKWFSDTPKKGDS